MADDQEQQASNRATVAGVDAKLDGLKDLVRAEFGAIQRQLDSVSSLPVTVAELKAQNVDQEKRLAVLETATKDDKNWRRTHLPTLLLSAALVLVGVVTLITQLHG